MKICFVDEAGDPGALAGSPQPNDQPVLVIGGLFIDTADLTTFTTDFLALKHGYFPNLPYLSNRPLDRILPEIKGAEIRRNATRGNARQRHHAYGLLDRIMSLLQRLEVRLVARIWGSRLPARRSTPHLSTPRRYRAFAVTSTTT